MLLPYWISSSSVTFQDLDQKSFLISRGRPAAVPSISGALCCALRVIAGNAGNTTALAAERFILSRHCSVLASPEVDVCSAGLNHKYTPNHRP